MTTWDSLGTMWTMLLKLFDHLSSEDFSSFLILFAAWFQMKVVVQCVPSQESVLGHLILPSLSAVISAL